MFRSSPDHVDSYYAATSRDLQLRRPALSGALDADVCIVGAGYFGLYTAIELARAGRRVVVLEASRVGWAASGRNGGQIILGFGTAMSRLKSLLGHERARRLFDASRAAAREMRALVAEHGIDCDLVDGHLEVAVLPRRVADLHAWLEECDRDWGYRGPRFVDKATLPQYLASPRYQAGIVDPEGGHLHPLKYALGLARVAESLGVRIFEQTRVDGYGERGERIRVRAAGHELRCDQIVLAANAYVDRIDPHLAHRTLAVGSFIGATEPLGEARARSLIPLNHAVCDNQFILEYFRRSADHRLLFGGKCSYLGGEPANLKAAMKVNLLRAFPSLADVRMEFGWGGHIDITMRRLPDWGRRGDRVFWAQGFCGHGVVPTKVASRLIADAVIGRPEELDAFAPLVNPPMPGGETIGGLLQAAGMLYYRVRDFI